MKYLSRDRKNVHFYMDAKNEPKITISSGERIEVETIRADNMYLSRENPIFRDHDHVMSELANPVTGPIYVEGAKAGDCLAVTIHDIVLGDCGNEGYYTYVPGQGVFANPFYPECFPPETYWCDVSRDKLQMELGKKQVTVETEPFIGTIGTALKEDVMASFYSHKEMLGNVDCHHIKKGSTIMIPVNVDGALLSLGDLHAKQGAGELLGCAVECDGKVTLSAEVVKRKDLPWFEWPQVNTPEFIGSLGFVNNSIEASIRSAVYDLIRRVEKGCGLSFMGAYMLIGQCVNIEICQMLGNACAALATLDRKVLNFEE